jgi:hypothetical protein
LCEEAPPTLALGALRVKPSSSVGGCHFAADPRLGANQAAVFWRPDVLPTVVLLEPAPESFSTAWILDVAQLGNTTAEQSGPDARHLIVHNKDGDVRLWLRRSFQNKPLAVVLPLDDDLPIRAQTALQFWLRVTSRAPGGTREPLALTRQRRDRLVLMLRALDGHLSDASYREVAENLFGGRRVEHEAWKTSSLRDRTIRLVRSSIALMRAGYRKLLRGR